MTAYELRPIGRVESVLQQRAEAPKQADEGAPEATLVLEERLVEGLAGLAPGAEVLILTWLDRGDREVLTVHPRSDPSRTAGVFATRSPDRPNPIGLHRATILAIERNRVRVDRLEALDGTPVLDLKPVLGRLEER